MPVHYGSKDLNFVTISSPLATQMPQGQFVVSKSYVKAILEFQTSVCKLATVWCYLVLRDLKLNEIRL